MSTDLIIKALTALAVVLLMSSLVGCGSTASREDPEAMSYILVSKGRASGVAKLFGAGVDYCKATAYNLRDVAFTGDIVYEADTCTVNITASDQ